MDLIFFLGTLDMGIGDAGEGMKKMGEMNQVIQQRGVEDWEVILDGDFLSFFGLSKVRPYMARKHAEGSGLLVC